MKNDVRIVERLPDGGGCLILWEKKKKGSFKKGVVLETSICDNPDCRYVHIRGFVVDERFENIRVDKDGLFYTLKKGIVNSEDIPKDKCLGFGTSIDIDTGEFDLEELPDEMDKDFKTWLAKEIKYKLGELIKHRWLKSKFKRDDAWKEKDWSWWEADVLLGWDEIYPNDWDFIVSVSGSLYWVQDLYCVNPQCACKDVRLVFFDINRKKSKDLGNVLLDMKKFRYDDMHSNTGETKVLETLKNEFMNIPDIKNRLLQRQKEMKKIGKELVKIKNKNGVLKSSPVVGPKVGRNDPCPCGSGKKFKKCCY